MATPALCRSSISSRTGCSAASDASSDRTASYARRRPASGSTEIRSRVAEHGAGLGQQRGERTRSGPGQTPRPVGGQRPEQRVQRVQHRLQEQGPLGGVAAGAQHPSAGLLGEPDRGLGERRLADARLAGDQHRGGPSPRRGGPGGRQFGELAVPPGRGRTADRVRRRWVGAPACGAGSTRCSARVRLVRVDAELVGQCARSRA